jgi:hypothetical protein
MERLEQQIPVPIHRLDDVIDLAGSKARTERLPPLAGPNFAHIERIDAMPTYSVLIAAS